MIVKHVQVIYACTVLHRIFNSDKVLFRTATGSFVSYGRQPRAVCETTICWWQALCDDGLVCPLNVKYADI